MRGTQTFGGGSEAFTPTVIKEAIPTSDRMSITRLIFPATRVCVAFVNKWEAVANNTIIYTLTDYLPTSRSVGDALGMGAANRGERVTIETTGEVRLGALNIDGTVMGNFVVVYNY